jgi:sialic acid synthase SpsE
MKPDTDIRIGNRRIALDAPTYFIADIAANHDGDLERAKALIWLAKEAGADCAKFQHFKAEKIVSDRGFRALGGQLGHQAASGTSRCSTSTAPTSSTAAGTTSSPPPHAPPTSTS